MFEQYTERARRVIFFSRYEASEFGSLYIESEFLLLALLRENKYVVIRWLGEGDWQTILRNEVEKRVYRGPKTSTSVDLPLSNEAKRVLNYAAEEAERLKHKYIGTEHLFLGLLHDRESRTAKLLFDRGVNPDTVRETIARESQHGSSAQEDARTGISGGGSRIVGSEYRVEISVVPEETSRPLQLDWFWRIPVVGEILSLDQDQGKSIVYQVVKVEWNVTAISIFPPRLAKVFIHVRELHK
ncbi:MAG TPA: Clp protease N-terminal domain-containing protein [Pseudacidobacterium sp.]|jgi:ATP-dependent Clp protease ATP-binding subunit ClpA|nr:Clp protease N-terminal domain-containing protein [Pseudacidobacterium sp.]